MQWAKVRVDGTFSEATFDGRWECVCECDVGMFDGEGAVELEGSGLG